MCGVWLGIDPGARGAVALRTAPGHCMAWRLQSLDAAHGTTIDAEHLYNTLIACASFDPQGVVIEKVSGLPGQSATAAWSFGFTCGLIDAACRRAELPVHYVAPQSWRAALGVHSYARKHNTKTTKDASRAVADILFPDAAHLWSRSTYIDLAEAALLAEFGAVKL